MTIPTLIDEPEADDLLCRAPEILAAVGPDPALEIHVSGYRMASRLRDLAMARRRDLVVRCLEDTPDGIEAIQDIAYAEQLAAHHLDYLNRSI